MDAPWRIQLLGALRAVQRDRVLTRFRTHKTGILLAYLAYYPQRAPSREELIEILWPGRDLLTGPNNLRVALSSLRRQLEPPGTPPGAVLEAHGATVQLNPRAYTTDVAHFESALQAAGRACSEMERIQRLTEAVEQYQGELLPGFFDAWILPERQRLLEACLQSLRQLAILLERAGDLPRAVQWARRAVFADPLREESQSELIRLFAAAGDPQSALRQYRELKELLAREIGVSPSAATQDMVRAIGCPSVDAGGAEELRSSRSKTPPESPPKSKTAAKPKGSAGRGSVTRPAPSSPCTGSVTFVLIEMTGGSGADPGHGSRTTQGGDAGRFAPGQTLVLPPGHVVRETAESLVLAFAEASDALTAAIAAHRALVETPTRPARSAPPVRIALHTGDVEAGAALHSPALQHGMRLLMAASSGQILLSALTAALLRDALGPGQHLVDRGLHRLRDQDRPERLFQFSEGGAADPELSFLHASPAPQGNLPLEFTRFFGREAEIAQLCTLLSGNQHGDMETRRRTGELKEGRLVTLTGPGGCGKTRLALAVAAHLRSGAGGEERVRCPSRVSARGCWFVSLQEIMDARLILDRVMRALQLPRSPHLEPLEQLVSFFSRTPALLLLDNFEQLVAEGSAVVRTLIERVPTLTLLVTSRQPLGLEGEREFPVGPLPVPVVSDQWSVVSPTKSKPSPSLPELAAGHWPLTTDLTTDHWPLATVASCPSVQLFIDRAQMVRPDFQLTPSNAAAVGALCRRLEGLPLAVELAAARVRALTPQQMLDRLSERFTLLASRRWDSEPRHQSLRASLDWSYQLLPPELQRFFAWLSIFRGGFTLEAATSILDFGIWILDCGLPAKASDPREPLPAVQNPNAQTRGPAPRFAPPPEIQNSQVLEYLDQLQGCSLLLASGESERRFAMLETLREYAAEHLASVDAATLARRHALYYLQLAETAEPELTRPGQSHWLERLEQEHDNLRAALDWCQNAVASGQWSVASPTTAVASGQWSVASPAGPGPKADSSLPELTTDHCRRDRPASGRRPGGLLGSAGVSGRGARTPAATPRAPQGGSGSRSRGPSEGPPVGRRSGAGPPWSGSRAPPAGGGPGDLPGGGRPAGGRRGARLSGNGTRKLRRL
jgi:predicted ATPase/DNA-binding SARP family transcriptional activator